MEVTIRDAEPEDASSLDVLRAQALKMTFEDEYDRQTVGDLVATVDEELPNWIDDDRYLVAVAETEVTPVSYAVFDRKNGTILSIVTSPDYEREGFGSAILAHVETAANEHGHESLSAVAPRSALAFFEACGFETAGTAEWHGLPGVRLEKSI
ncbi:GNAT family N-acetyltransferase [Halapricum desulfuricans]|uniref:Acetyltransferase (GNAT) family n=1 Tax=Halapricum desulfuricans TaxID=2841257 RepID=A0A897NMI4_9EURY|nr:GNAT family N-acetyltransferase [Halapricum desulfuricans]QSG09169.1 Acetyltransferase (GNAT) family [Halapricum desulfuricans]QSG12103.1 Acetyltransferase (GNAT) family [Halapricum desulfuricans]